PLNAERARQPGPLADVFEHLAPALADLESSGRIARESFGLGRHHREQQGKRDGGAAFFELLLHLFRTSACLVEATEHRQGEATVDLQRRVAGAHGVLLLPPDQYFGKRGRAVKPRCDAVRLNPRLQVGQTKTLGYSRSPLRVLAPRVHAAVHMGYRAEPKEGDVERELISGPFELRQRLAGEAFEPLGRALGIDES